MNSQYFNLIFYICNYFSMIRIMQIANNTVRTCKCPICVVIVLWSYRFRVMMKEKNRISDSAGFTVNFKKIKIVFAIQGKMIF